MLRKSFIASISFIALALVSIQIAQAQERDQILRGEAPECNRVVWSCTEVEDLDKDKSPTEGSHRLKLTIGGLDARGANGELNNYVVACGIDTDRGYVATTGNAQLDDDYCLNSLDGNGFKALKYLQDNYNYTLKKHDFNNPFTDADGNIEVVVEPGNSGLEGTEAAEPQNHLCFVGYKVPEEAVGNDPDGPVGQVDEEDTGLQYGSFRGFQGIAACQATYFDPYGRVYNEDLKPVPGVDVSLFNHDSGELINLFGIPNPTFTGNSGIFNFNVPPGNYNMTASLPNNTEVHPNHSLAYTTPPYLFGDIIVETGEKAEQRDIPIIGGAEPVLELASYTHLRTGDKILIHGAATWPLTIVDLVQGSTSLEQQQSDRFGNFYYELDPARIDPKQEIVVRLTEVDLTLSADLPAADPATDEIAIDPIPSYLEGFAYIDGKLAPFATVRVRLTLTDGIFYETKADKDAFFTVMPKDLPIMPFYLEYLPAQNVPVVTGTGGTGVTGTPDPTTTPAKQTGTATVNGAVVSIPDYAKQNEEYHDTNIVDIMAGTKNGQKVDPLVVNPSEYGNDGMMKDGSSIKTDGQKGESMEEQPAQQRFLTLLILVVLLIFVGTGAVLLLRKKGRTDHFGGGENTYQKEESKDNSVDNPLEE